MGIVIGGALIVLNVAVVALIGGLVADARRDRSA